MPSPNAVRPSGNAPGTDVMRSTRTSSPTTSQTPVRASKRRLADSTRSCRNFVESSSARSARSISASTSFCLRWFSAAGTASDRVSAIPNLVNHDCHVVRAGPGPSAPGARIDYAQRSIVDSTPARRDSVYHDGRAPNPRETTMRRFDLVLPNSLEDCVKILAERGDRAKLLAGGTDLLPQMKNGVIKPSLVVDLSGVARVRQIHGGNGQGLRIGAAVTARELEVSPTVRGAYQAIAESGALVGSLQVRNLATLGGNLCNAAPSADMAPPLVALDAEAVIAGPKGERRVPIARFFTGVRKTVLAPNEMLVELAVPSPGAHSGGQYLRHTPRRELDIAVVGVASQLTLENGRCVKARIALASVAPTPVRATAAERALEGQTVTPELIERAANLAVDAAQPIDDQRGSIEFRRHLVRVLTRRTLVTARERASH